MERTTASREERHAALAPLDDEAISAIDLALREDIGSGDWTSHWTINARTRAQAEITAKASGTLAGIAPTLAVFTRVDPRVSCEAHVRDGDRVGPGDLIASLKGPGRAVLTAERVALNLLQHLSGIATLTRLFVDAVEGTGARVLDTRKTMPGLRSLEKAAVRAGGGANHRTGLFDMVLIKDNHLAIVGSIAEAVSRVREQNSRGLLLEVEVRTFDELGAALHADVDRILLDNMSVEQLREAVRVVRKHRKPPVLEASGNVSLQTIRAIAETGVDEISVGALTHSAPALDFSLRVVRP